MRGVVKMKLCLYGASSENIDEVYKKEVEALGKVLGKKGHSIVFGGGAKGLMGAAARGVYSEKGEIIGVSPNFFNVDGVLFENCTELIYTETMRERKALMEELSDGFIVLPGGIGTYEEFFEILTLRQLGRHNKPISIFNINGYFDKMIELFDVTIKEGFMKNECRELFSVFSSAKELVDYMENYKVYECDINRYKDLK